MARVLVGYESSGVVREAFRAMGHDAWSCDLQAADDGSEYHLQCDIFEVITQRWDLGIFHPMCTYLTNSAAWAYKDGPYHMKIRPGTLVGRARRLARQRAIEEVRQLMQLPYPHAIENPVGVLSSAIRKPSQIIHPWQFGDDASKATCLWLHRLPVLVPTKTVAPRLVCCGAVLPDGVGKYGCPNCNGDKVAKPRWSNQTNSGQNNVTPGADRWKQRSRTYPGIASAMASQWGAVLR